MEQIQKGIYKHYKGNRYEVLDTAVHTETREHMVIYKALYKGDFPDGQLWARPLAMFKENVTVDGNLVPRFRYLSCLLGLMALLLIAPHGYAKEARLPLTIVQGQAKLVLTENDFRQLHLDSVVVQDPVYNKHKRYEGYWLSDIFAYAGIHPDPDTVWTFTALDGYKASIAVADVLQSGCKSFVAVEDLDKEEGWEKIQQGKEWISPGPYYLVWKTPMEDVTPRVKLPWPYQMVEISIHKSDETQQKLFPDSNDKSESITRGYKVFKQNCMACHSLNLQGGVVGPELNVPKNILEYEDRKFLREFIGNPSSFRARSKMPAFNNTLSDQELDDVLDYLAWIGKHKM